MLDGQLDRIDILSGDIIFGGYVYARQLEKYSNMRAVSQWFSIGIKSS